MPVEDLLNQFAKEDAANQKQALSRSALAAHNVNPDQHVANQKKAKKAGIPSALATPATGPVNGDDLKALMDDFHKLPPNTAQFMANQEHAKKAHDDHPVLSKLEGLFNDWLARPIKGAGASMAAGVNASLGAVDRSFGLDQGAAMYEKGAEYWRKVAEKNKMGGLTGKVYEGVGAAPMGVAEYTAGVPYAAAKGAAEGYQKDGIQGLVKGALAETVKRYGIGKVFKGLENAPLSPVQRTTAMAGTMGVQTAAEGGNLQDVVASTLTGAALMLPGAKTHGEAVKSSLLKAGVAPEIAHEIGTHVDGVTAHVNAQQVQDIVDTAKESKLAKRSPEDFQAFAKAAGKKAKPVSMPVEKFDAMLKGRKPEEVLTDPAAYYEAKAEGGKVEIPASDLAGMAEHVTPEAVKEMSTEDAPSVAEVESKGEEQPQTGNTGPSKIDNAYDFATMIRKEVSETFAMTKEQPDESRTAAAKAVYDKYGVKTKTDDYAGVRAEMSDFIDAYERYKTSQLKKGKTKPQLLTPAVQTEEGIKTGKEGERHTDIVPGAPEESRGFVTPDGQFLDREQAAQFLKDNEPQAYDKLSEDAKHKLHSEDLWGARELNATRTIEKHGFKIIHDTALQDDRYGHFDHDTKEIRVNPKGLSKAELKMREDHEIYHALADKHPEIAEGIHEEISDIINEAALDDMNWTAGEDAREEYQETGDDGRLQTLQMQQVDDFRGQLGTSNGVSFATDEEEVAARVFAQDWDGLKGYFTPERMDELKDVVSQINEVFPEEGGTKDNTKAEGANAGDNLVYLHAGLNPLDGVRAAMGIASDIRDSKLGRKVEQLMTPGLEAGKEAKRGALSLVAPTLKSAEHLEAAELLGAKLGKMHRNQEVSAEALRADEAAFEKLGIRRDDQPLTENTGIRFMSDMSQGREMSPELQEVADRIRSQFDDRLRQLEEADVPMETIRENYFPGMWTNESRKAFNQAMNGAVERGIGEGKPLAEWTAEEKQYVRDRVKQLMEGGKGSDKSALGYLTRTPFKGKESFRKAKVFDDIMTAVEFGLEPTDPNPVTLTKLKLAEMDRSIMANSALKEWREKGDEKFLPVNQKVPEGWVKVNDKYGTVYGPRDMAGEDVYIGRPILGYRIAKEPVADVLNNYLSSSMYNNKYFGAPYRAYMGAANLLNQSQLGVGSFFHVGFTESEVTISGGANLLKDIYGLVKGNRSVKQVAKSAVDLPLSFAKTPFEGDQILKEWRDPGSSMNPKVQQVAKAAELAGGGFRLEQGLQTEQTQKMKQDWYNDRKVKAALRSPVSVIELMAKPIMEWLVPRQKAGVFGHLAQRIIEQNPGKSLEELTPEFRQAWNRVDARLGQVRYDRLFMHNAAKSTVQAVVRAPGWSGGTIAEIGGAFKDAAKFVKEWAETGKAPEELPDRVAYTLSLMAIVSGTNALLTYAFTGDKPEGMDYWAFRTGGTDEHGNPERFLLPTYQKDIYAYWQDPGKVLLAKSHPIISLMGDILKNKDYYGVTIAPEDDNAMQKAIDRGEYVAKQFVPFWIRGAQKEAERGGGLLETLQTQPQKILAPQIGIMPAPSDYTKSDASKLLSKYIGEQIPSGGRTQEDADHSKARREIVRALRNGATLDSLPEKLQTEAEKFTPKQLSAMEKDSKFTPLQSSFKHLQDPTLEKSLKIWDKASDKERDELRDLYETRINKYFLAHENLEQPEVDKLNDRIEQAENRTLNKGGK